MDEQVVKRYNYMIFDHDIEVCTDDQVKVYKWNKIFFQLEGRVKNVEYAFSKKWNMNSTILNMYTSD